MIPSFKPPRSQSDARLDVGETGSQPSEKHSEDGKKERKRTPVWWVRSATALVAGYIIAAQALMNLSGWSFLALAFATLLAGLLLVGSRYRVWRPRVGKWIWVPVVFVCYCLIRSFPATSDTNPLDTFAQLASAFFGGIAVAAALKVGVSFRAVVFAQLASSLVQIVIILGGLGPEPAPGEETFRYAGITGNANELALQLGLGACLIWFRPRRAGWLGCLAAFGFIGFAVAVTGSRKALLVALFFLILVAIQSMELVPRKRRPFVMAIAIAASCMIGLFVVPLIIDQAQDLLTIQRTVDYNDSSYRTRVDMAQDAIRLWEKTPLFGNGMDAFSGLSREGTYAHNNYVELLCDIGLVGTLLYYALHVQVLICATRLRKSLRLYCWVLILLMLVADMGYVSYKRKQSVMILVMMLAVSTSSRFAVSERRPFRERSSARLKQLQPAPRRFVFNG